MDDRTALARVTRPARERFLPFQPLRRPPTLLMRGWKSILRSLRKWRGIPRYLPGKLAILAGKSAKTFARSIPSHLIGKASDLDTFVMRPLASPKSCKSAELVTISSFWGLAKMPMSSAHKEILQRTERAPTGRRRPHSSARRRMTWRGSMAKMKSSGERGSP